MTSARRHAAMTGTWRSSAKRSSSVEVRARRTPATGQDDRPLGGGQELDHRPDLVVRGRSAGGRARIDRASSGIGSSSRSSGQGEQDRARPATERLADRLGHRGRDLGGARVARRPTWPARRASRPGRSPGTPRAAMRARSTWPTDANIGVESWRAVWMPMARFAPPDRARPEATAGRPVSWPCASAMNAAPPS